MTQSTVASQPLLDSTGLNGLLAVNTTSGRWLQNTTFAFPTTYSIFAVAYTTSTSSYARLLTTDGQLVFGALDGNNSDFTGNAGVWNDYAVNSPSLPVTSWGIKGMTNTGIGTNEIPYLNGTAQTAKVGTVVTFTGLTLGITNNVAVQHWNGYIAEVLIYNSVLSASDRKKTEGYLAWKWGLQSKLPVDHTYKTAAP
jgi:hypothetical protein